MELKIGDKVVVKDHRVFTGEIQKGDEAVIIDVDIKYYHLIFNNELEQVVAKQIADRFIEKEQDTYNRTYDYDDMKIALCIQDFLDNDKPDMQINFQDFEDIIELAIRIRKSYDKCNKEGTLTKEEQGYIQQFAYNYLKENYGD